MKKMIDIGEKISVEQYLASCHAQKILTKKFELTMKHYDFLITPSTGSVAPRIGKLEKTDSCLIWTFFGAPAISLPIFFDCKDRLPFGLQIIAKRYDDFSILDFAQKIITKVR
jgi:Asp-tRNA(Asn)/Glu-tRNA(Gln) amidotransferase A subunit family amidase